MQIYKTPRQCKRAINVCGGHKAIYLFVLDPILKMDHNYQKIHVPNLSPTHAGRRLMTRSCPLMTNNTAKHNLLCLPFMYKLMQSTPGSAHIGDSMSSDSQKRGRVKNLLLAVPSRECLSLETAHTKQNKSIMTPILEPHFKGPFAPFLLNLIKQCFERVCVEL